MLAATLTQFIDLIVVVLGASLLAARTQTFAKYVNYLAVPAGFTVVVFPVLLMVYRGIIPNQFYSNYVVMGVLNLFLGSMMGFVHLLNHSGDLDYRSGGIGAAELSIVMNALQEPNPDRKRKIGKPARMTIVGLIVTISLLFLASLYVVFLAYVLAAQWKDLGFIDAAIPTLLSPLNWLLAAPLVLIWRRARRTFAADAKNILEGESLPPHACLLLRSFADDSASLTPYTWTRRFHTGRIRLEEVLIRVLGNARPCVALGSPGERIPQLGAFRTYVQDHEWQPTVERWLEEADTVIVVAGKTEWVRWELDRIGDRRLFRKTIVVIPPGMKKEANVIDAFVGHLIKTVGHSPIDNSQMKRLLAVGWSSHGGIRLITGNNGDAIEYEFAFMVASALRDMPRTASVSRAEFPNSREIPVRSGARAP